MIHAIQEIVTVGQGRPPGHNRPIDDYSDPDLASKSKFSSMYLFILCIVILIKYHLVRTINGHEYRGEFIGCDDQFSWSLWNVQGE